MCASSRRGRKGGRIFRPAPCRRQPVWRSGRTPTLPTILHAAPIWGLGKREAIHPVNDSRILGINFDALDQRAKDLPPIGGVHRADAIFDLRCECLKMANVKPHLPDLLLLL